MAAVNIGLADTNQFRMTATMQSADVRNVRPNVMRIRFMNPLATSVAQDQGSEELTRISEPLVGYIPQPGPLPLVAAQERSLVSAGSYRAETAGSGDSIRSIVNWLAECSGV